MQVSEKNSAVVGAFFGDEAKARVVHWMAKNYKYIVRWSGSSNAGHTIYHKGKKIVRHLLPSADFTADNYAFLGSGMVINPEELLQEVRETEEMFPGSASRIIVDPDAFIITKEHLAEDKANVIKFGSTGKGVSVAYKDKIYRQGTKISSLVKDNNEIIITLKKMGVQFKYNLELYNEFKEAPILFEGAQSVLLDLNFGTYPYVTSGECTPGGIFNAGFSYAMPKTVYGISKCYATRVGEGPFPTELFDKEAEELRAAGKEYGATTGRPRRVGWLDLPALDYVCKRGGITNIILTKFDVLNNMDKVPVCTSYNKQVSCAEDFFDAKPNYTLINGWSNASDISQIMPLIKMVEDYTNKEVSYVSVGTSEDDMISC